MNRNRKKNKAETAYKRHKEKIPQNCVCTHKRPCIHVGFTSHNARDMEASPWSPTVRFRVVSMLTLRGSKCSVLLQPAAEDTLDISLHQLTAVPAAPPPPVNMSGDSVVTQPPPHVEQEWPSDRLRPDTSRQGMKRIFQLFMSARLLLICFATHIM